MTREDAIHAAKAYMIDELEAIRLCPYYEGNRVVIYDEDCPVYERALPPHHRDLNQIGWLFLRCLTEFYMETFGYWVRMTEHAITIGLDDHVIKSFGYERGSTVVVRKRPRRSPTINWAMEGF